MQPGIGSASTVTVASSVLLFPEGSVTRRVICWVPVEAKLRLDVKADSGSLANLTSDVNPQASED